jgi:hypothetical protein
VRPVAPRTGAPEVQVAEEQEEYAPLAMAVYLDPAGTRMLLSRWTFTDEERRRIAAGEDLYVHQLNFGGGITPFGCQVGPEGWTVEGGDAR